MSKSFGQALGMISFLVLATLTRTVQANFGLQSGPDPVSSPGAFTIGRGMRVDRLNNRVLLTGNSNSEFWRDAGDDRRRRTNELDEPTNCFLASVPLEFPLPSGPDEPFNWTLVNKNELGTVTSSEICYDLEYKDQGEGEESLIVTGNSLPNPDGGLLAPIKPPGGAIKPFVYGNVLDVIYYDDGIDPSVENFDLQGGRLMRIEQVHYPLHVTSDATGEFTFVASILSADKTANEPPDNSHLNRPSWWYPFGSNYYIYLERLEPKFNSGSFGQLQETLSRTWDLTLGNADKEPMYASGLIYGKPNTLYLSGSSEGRTKAFPADADNVVNGTLDTDGFLTEISATDGSLTGRALRFSSQKDSVERVLGMCQQEGDEQELYVVGTSTGDMVNPTGGVADGIGKAFIAKVKLSTLTVIWTKQLGAVTGPLQESGTEPWLEGVACAVTSDGERVYLAGRTRHGSVVVSTEAPLQKSFGGTDVVVASYKAQEGELFYVRQIGTSGNEEVSSIDVDDDGNAIVYGTTNGSFMRQREPGETVQTDIFLFSVSREGGEYRIPNEQRGPAVPTTAPPPTAAPQASPQAAPTTPPVASERPPSLAPASPPTIVPAATPVPTTKATTPPSPTTGVDNAVTPSSGGKKSRPGLIVFLLLLSIGLMAGALYMYRQKRKRRYPHDSDHVVEYLKGFDNVEVDLKHSATGGWHGTYIKYPNDEARPFPKEVSVDSINSTIVQDSLFMDDYDLSDHRSSSHGFGDPLSQSLIGDDRFDGGGGDGLMRGKSQYDGLVDAYNSTWEDLSPTGGGLRPSSSSTTSRRSSRKSREQTDLLDRSEEGWGDEII